MSGSIAERYLELFQHDESIRLALLACSAALQLDDETACEAVDLVANTNGSSYTLVRRVKKLGCVWKEWNGFWHVSEDVRRGLFDRLYSDLSDTTLIKLRELLARAAASRAARITSDDQAAVHERMVAKLEAAYHRVLIPEQAEEGANQLVELWRQLPPLDRDAFALSVDYLADELEQRLDRLPDEIVFLRGIAAHERGDSRAQKKYFDLVWENPDLQSDVEAKLNEDLETHVPVPLDTTVIETLHEQAYEFAVSYYRERSTRAAKGPDTLIDELYEKFYEPHRRAWQNLAEFYAYVAQMIRHIIVKSARTQYSTKLDSRLFSRWINNEFDMPAMAADLLALNKAFAVLREYDPDQARIVELRLYAGLTFEKIADVLQLHVGIVKREWHTARAFLRRNLTSGSIDASALVAVSHMTNTASFLRQFNP